MSDSKKKAAHRHRYEKIIEWITWPRDECDVGHYFSVVGQCECGVSKKRDAELSEVEGYIKDQTCSHCGAYGMKHGTESECIRDLHLRVKFLEDRLNKVCDALSGIGR